MLVSSVIAVGCGSSKKKALVCSNDDAGAVAVAGKEGADPTGSGDAGPPRDAGGAPVDASGDAPRATSGAAAITQEIDRELGLIRSTAYSHETQVDERAGTFNVDCSGFLNYVLERAVPAQYEAFHAATTSRPLAKDYANYMNALPSGAPRDGWRRVTRAIDLVPGDMVGWVLNPDSNNGDSGHVVFVSGAVGINADRADEVLVPVTDATWHAHGTIDPRSKSKSGGIGTGGMIGILIDGNGAPKGYRWNGGCGPDQGSAVLSMGHVD